MALKPFYNKKGHLGMTRQQLLEKLNGAGGGGGIKGTLKLTNSDANTPNFQITAYSTIFSFLDSCDICTMCATQDYTIPYGEEVDVEVEILRQLEYSDIITESEDPGNVTIIVGSFNNWDTSIGGFVITARNSKCVGSDTYHRYLLANGFEISGYKPTEAV